MHLECYHLVNHSFGVQDIIVAGSPVAGVVRVTGTTGFVAVCFSERLIFAPGKDTDLAEWTNSCGTVPASPLVVCTSIAHSGSRSNEETPLSVLICHLEEVVLGPGKKLGPK